MPVKNYLDKRSIFSLLLIVLVSIPVRVIPQSGLQDSDRIYGLDQTLYNGRRYGYFLPQGVTGHQYIFSPEFVTGSVTIRGKCYPGLTLNYDLVNQQLLLKYLDERGAPNIIEVSRSWLDSFCLGPMNFGFRDKDHDPRFFQVLGDGRLKILYYWQKSLNLDGTIGATKYSFTTARRDFYLLIDGQLKPFGTRRGLIRIFDPGRRQEIKNYLRKNRINLKTASDPEMVKMINFIGNLN